ncbi:MAG TPA: hypothetical protein VK961_28430 [Chthoniobacter sp.]|nr:hypothetical protein [Chthoniobacter sp.]
MNLRSVVLLLSTCWGWIGLSAQAAPRVFHEANVSFTYDDSVLKKPGVRHVKALQLTTPTDIPEGVAPAHIEIQFGKDQGRLWIFPATDSGVKDFRKAYPTHADAQKLLRTVLRERPEKRKELPSLPWADTGQAFNKKLRYLDFHGGSGIAWLTQWTIEPVPVNNSQLQYRFQGLTKDGAFYVAAQINVSHPSLPAKPEVKDYRTFEKHYAAYLEKAAQEIGAQPDESFQPSLAKLRAMFESIQITAAP